MKITFFTLIILLPLFFSTAYGQSQSPNQVVEPISSHDIKNFEVNQQDNYVVIHWKILSGSKIKAIEVLASVDGTHWDLLTVMPGPGKDNDTFDYASVIERNSETYFLLKEIEYSGNESYSTVKTLPLNKVENDKLMSSISVQNTDEKH